LVIIARGWLGRMLFKFFWCISLFPLTSLHTTNRSSIFTHAFKQRKHHDKLHEEEWESHDDNHFLQRGNTRGWGNDQQGTCDRPNGAGPHHAVTSRCLIFFTGSEHIVN